MLKLFIFIAALLFPIAVQASELSARELNDYCMETEKGFLGHKFDASKSEICRGYIMGFFDSMVVVDTIGGKKHFCLPPSLPKSQNTLLLKTWVKENQNIAESTTAAVALFSAYAKSFPCNR